MLQRTNEALQRTNEANSALLEKVITQNDLGGLTSLEKVQHIKNVCESLGLNPLTKPIQLLKFQGKEIAYFTKDATEQLRKSNGISIRIRDTKVQEGIYIVIVDAKTPDGREDSSSGAISISGLKGEALCNAMLKAETKAKRRVTLSICGLGFTDESEIESMSGHKKINLPSPKEQQELIGDETVDIDFNADVDRLEKASNLDELHEAYKAAYKYWAERRDNGRLKKIIDLKDIRKNEIEIHIKTKELDSVDVEAGEIENVR
jgi:hypothetical protein